MITPTRLARRFVVRGVVQGVGFRPHLQLLAQELGLVGSCHNDATCVVVEVEGTPSAVAEFEFRMSADAPPLARVESVVGVDTDSLATARFEITSSTTNTGLRTDVPPDTAPCARCLSEFADPTDRRYRHPFITCTYCGPRLSITLDLPYDRDRTTMAAFTMCAACAAEYTDPQDPRFHAQPIACHDCGPALWISRVADGGSGPFLRDVRLTGPRRVIGERAARIAIEALREGAIVAIKGLGGFHLACDATNSAAVARLRRRKGRPDQPFALMVADLATARKIVDTTGAEELLCSPQRPIVVLATRDGTAPETPCSEVAPGLGELGVMLPYTPLHQLLFSPGLDGEPGAPPVLVMTSGNVSGEPLCYLDEEARERLAGIVDLMLGHDRVISAPVEDSVFVWSSTTGAVPVRRSRGYAPLPTSMDGRPAAQATVTDPVILAAGAELKNTVAISRDGRVYLSAHVGDLASLPGRQAHQLAIDRLTAFHLARPDLIVADLHPGYASSAWARRRAAELGVDLLSVQHHHAHLAALAAEHQRLPQDLLGLVFDGTGFGCDGGVWGGELLLLTDGGRTAERLGHLGTIRLPGSDAGVLNPVRTAALALLDAGESLDLPTVDSELSGSERSLLIQAQRSGVAVVDTSSVGRLFDVVAALLGVRSRVSYEGQAAVELEALARQAETAGAAIVLPFPVEHGILDPRPLICAVATQVRAGSDRAALARGFHRALARGAAELAAKAARPRGLNVVGVSGGVFVNRLLLTDLAIELQAYGLDILTHRRFPGTDGGLALGQAAIGEAHLRAIRGQPSHEILISNQLHTQGNKALR